MLTKRQRVAVFLMLCGLALQSAPISYNETLGGAWVTFLLFLAACVVWGTEV
jgi:hypothetical protein